MRLSEQEPRLRCKLVSDTEAEGMLDGHAICTSAADPDGVIIAVRMGLFRSKDQGKTWEDLRVDRYSPFTYGRDVRVSPQDPKHALCVSQRRGLVEGRRAVSQPGHRQELAALRQGAAARHADVGQLASLGRQAGLYRGTLRRGIRHPGRR